MMPARQRTARHGFRRVEAPDAAGIGLTPGPPSTERWRPAVGRAGIDPVRPLGNPKGSALFPYASPALFSMTIAFVGIWLFSILDNSKRAKIDRDGFLAQQVRSETGIGASGASGH